MNIRFFRPLAALGLAAVIAVAGSGAALTPSWRSGVAPATTALSIEVVPALQFADYLDGAPADPALQFADYLDGAPADPDLQFC